MIIGNAPVLTDSTIAKDSSRVLSCHVRQFDASKVFATLGEVCSSELSDSDILDAFLCELEFLGDSATRGIRADFDSICDDAGQVSPACTGYLAQLLCNAREALARHSAPYVSFAERNGTFGFWPDVEKLQDVPNVDALPIFGIGFTVVDGHAGTALFWRESSVDVWREIWATC